MTPSWWVPVKWPSVSAPLSAPQDSHAALAPATFGLIPFRFKAPVSSPVEHSSPTPFVPFHYTNRPTGPLIGAVKSLPDTKPTQTSQALGLAKGIINAARTAVLGAVQVAAQLGASAASSVAGAIPVVNAAVSAVTVGLSAGQLSEAKTRAAKETSAQGIAQGVVSLIPGVGLIAIPQAIEGFTDAANAKKRAKRVQKEYEQHAKVIQEKLSVVVRPSDRLDELAMLPRVSRAQQIAWCRASVTAAAAAFPAGDLLSPAITHIQNGEAWMRIPGRDATELWKLYGNGIRDAIILYFSCRDILNRLGAPFGSPWPPTNVLNALPSGYNGDEALGVLPGRESKVTIGAPPGWNIGNTEGIGVVSIAPVLSSITDYVVSRPGWSLWALIQYFDLGRGTRNTGQFKATPFYARVVSTRALETIDKVAPRPEKDIPHLPTPVEIQASLDTVRGRAGAVATQAANDQALRDELFHEAQWANTA